MDNSTIPSECHYRDPKTLQPARVASKARIIDRDTMLDLLDVAATFTRALKVKGPDRIARSKIMDVNSDLIRIVREAVEGY